MFATIPLYLLLAQTCVAEISFQRDPSECILMWEVNERNARLRNRSLRKQTLLYNSYWKSTEQRNRRPWIQHLKGREQPKHWPERLKWKWHVKMWLRYVKAAREFLDTKNKRVPICPAAYDYGAPREYPGGYMKPVVCLRKANQWFWARKSEEELIHMKKGIISKRSSKKRAVSKSILTMKRENQNGASE